MAGNASALDANILRANRKRQSTAALQDLPLYFPALGLITGFMTPTLRFLSETVEIRG